MSGFIIRTEQPSDFADITRVNESAFKSEPHSDQTEHFIVLRLRAAGALTVSLVAEQRNHVVGHIAISPVQFSDGSTGWYGLGPVAVLPELHHQGIGKTLINSGLAFLRSSGAAGCVVLGNPDYYGRFGFGNRPECIFEGVPAEYFQVLAFKPQFPVGTVTYHAAFSEPGLTS